MSRSRVEIWAADCETDPFKPGRIPQPFIWGAYDIRTGQYETFGSAELFVAFFRERRATVYFHNGGKFDSYYLRAYFESDQDLLIINGRIAKFRIGRTEFRDSYNLIPVPLATYSKEKIDYDIFEIEKRSLPENSSKIEAYLKSDCVNLANLLSAYFEKFGKGFTQAGAAMTYWAKHYNGNKKPRQTAAQFERYRPYYYGGRVECFASGYAECSFTVVDKNSAYPHAMLQEHPISTEAVSLSTLPEDESKMAQCFVTLRAVSRGAFPFRLPSGELIFPRDSNVRTYHVTGWELLAARTMEAVDVREVIAVHYFRETINFKGYINHFYLERKAAKKAGDKAGDIFAKLFMNSCYGKFAANPENYNEYRLSSVEKLIDHLGDGFSRYHEWGDGRELLWRKLPLERHHYYNIATASSITGFVRAELYKDLCRVRTPLYCDTDSIAAENVDNLQIGGELGEWKVELYCDAYGIVGKKTYAMRSAHNQKWNAADKAYEFPKGSFKHACKGVQLTAEQIIRVSRGEEIRYNPSVPTYSITRPQPRFIGRNVRVTANVQLGSLLGV